MGSVARQLALLGGGAVLLALAATGGITAGILHLRAQSALDASLLAAAHAHSGRPPSWEVEHSDAPVDVWVARPGDGRVPDALVMEAAEAERPVFLDIDEDRLLLLPAEEERHRDRERHLVVVARAHRVTVARSVGPFALIYAAVAAGVAAVTALAQGALLRRAFRPMVAAQREAGEVVGLAQGSRLTEAGPDEIRAFLQAINGLLDRLDAAHRAQARFTDEAAHELRTPIAILRGELELALRRPREAEQYRETLRSMEEEVARLAALVEGLLSLARLDAGGGAAKEELGSQEIAEAALAAERGALDRAGCTARLELRAEARVRASRALVVSAVGNLLRNAAVHAPGSEVRLAVDVDVDAQVAVFRVEDQGPGVPEAEREAVFHRLTRGGEARRQDRDGLGLGLPLAREVARRHGGACWLEEAPGGGCAAVLTLPVMKGA